MSYGRSLALRQNNFVQPPDGNDARDENDTGTRPRRQATVYDAVAGKLLHLRN